MKDDKSVNRCDFLMKVLLWVQELNDVFACSDVEGADASGSESLAAMLNPQFLGEAAHERVDCSFGCGVIDGERRSVQAGHR